MSIKNLLVWTGGKSRLIPEIEKRIPKDINKQYDTYIEPFVGGGSVFFYIIENYNFKNIYINDKNSDLINLYLAFKEKPKEIFDKIEKLDLKYLSFDVEKKKEMFYLMRKNYNRMKLKDGKINLEKANLLMFLMRLCFNGIYRVSKKGEFTNSLGNYLKRAYKRIKKETVEEISEKLKTVNISCVDFSELENLINDKTFFLFRSTLFTRKKSSKSYAI